MGIDSIAAVQGRIASIQALAGGANARPAGNAGFAQVLEASIATSSTASTAETEVHASGANGRLDENRLADIGVGSHRLQPAAAAAFERMRGAAAAAGVAIGVTDSYRTYDQQVDLARRKGLYSEGGLAARPGTSPHGWGLAVDLDVDDAGLAWLRANAGRFGFSEDVPREPWHWEFQHGR